MMLPMIAMWLVVALVGYSLWGWRAPTAVLGGVKAMAWPPLVVFAVSMPGPLSRAMNHLPVGAASVSDVAKGLVVLTLLCALPAFGIGYAITRKRLSAESRPPSGR